MILNRGPPSGFETSNKISNSGGTDMYIEHPYFYEGKIKKVAGEKKYSPATLSLMNKSQFFLTILTII